MEGALLQKFQQRCQERVPERGLALHTDGLLLGVTVLAKFADGQLRLDERRILSLLSVACGEPVSSRAMGYIHAAVKAYGSGDGLMTAMHLALAIPQTYLRQEKSYEKAFRVFCAEALLAEGMQPQQLVKSLGLAKDDASDDDENDEEEDDSNDDEADSASSSDDDFDSKDPRWPAGSPDGQGGEFAPKGSSNAGVATTRTDISNYEPLSYTSSGSSTSGEPQYHGDPDNDRVDSSNLLEDAALLVSGIGEVRAGISSIQALIEGATGEVTTTGINSLTAEQAENLSRFEAKLPVAAQSTNIIDLLDGSKIFQEDVPASNIPGSFARYEKTVDSSGNTVSYIKTTYAPDGTIVHVKSK